jgi:hypothetical protein
MPWPTRSIEIRIRRGNLGTLALLAFTSEIVEENYQIVWRTEAFHRVGYECEIRYPESGKFAVSSIETMTDNLNATPWKFWGVN